MCCCGCHLFLELEHHAQRVLAEERAFAAPIDAPAIAVGQGAAQAKRIKLPSLMRRWLGLLASLLQTTPEAAR